MVEDRTANPANTADSLINLPRDRAALRKRMLRDPEALADAVISGLSAAGGKTEWDSETIEQVLTPFEGVIKASGMPWVGSTGEDVSSANAWRVMTPKAWNTLCLTCWDEDGLAEEHTVDEHHNMPNDPEGDSDNR